MKEHIIEFSFVGQEGMQIVEIIQSFGRYDACLVEVSSKATWKLYKGTG